MTVDVGRLRALMAQARARQIDEALMRPYRRGRSLRRAALSSTSHTAIRARDMVKMMGLP